MDNLRELETFESVSELNEYISKILAQVELKTLERELLWLLSGHSVKFIGVSFLKLDSMAELLGVSKRTIQRTLKALGEIGIIKRINKLRPKRGGFGASVTLICPVELSIRKEATDTAPERTEEPSQNSETIFSKATNIFKDKERKEAELDSSFLVNSHIPQSFIDTVKPFFGSAKEIYSLWGKVLLSSKKYAPSVIEIDETAIQAFKQTVFAHKLRKIKKDFKGYFWGTLTRMFSVEQRRASNPAHFYNWLED